MTESLKGNLVSMARGDGGGGGGLTLNCVSCEPNQTADILLEIIVPGTQWVNSQPPPLPHVLIPTEAGQCELFHPHHGVYPQ